MRNVEFPLSSVQAAGVKHAFIAGLGHLRLPDRLVHLVSLESRAEAFKKNKFIKQDNGILPLAFAWRLSV